MDGQRSWMPGLLLVMSASVPSGASADGLARSILGPFTFPAGVTYGGRRTWISASHA